MRTSSGMLLVQLESQSSIYYPNEGHGFLEPENGAGHRRQLERLLAKSLERMR